MKIRVKYGKHWGGVTDKSFQENCRQVLDYLEHKGMKVPYAGIRVTFECEERQVTGFVQPKIINIVGLNNGKHLGDQQLNFMVSLINALEIFSGATVIHHLHDTSTPANLSIP